MTMSDNPSALMMPKMRGIATPVIRPVGVVGMHSAESRIGVGDASDGDGRGVFISVAHEDGECLVALMGIAKAEQFAMLIMESVGRGRATLLAARTGDA